MEAKAIKKPLQKNIKKMMPKMTPNWSHRGSQNGAKTVKNEVLEASCFKAGSQVASRPLPGSILERFGDHLANQFHHFVHVFCGSSGRARKQHVANRDVQNHKGSSTKISRCVAKPSMGRASVTPLSHFRQCCFSLEGRH